MMRDIFGSLSLPDDRPVTSLVIVEEIFGCPPNYTVVSKTHDQDIDADLCKDGFFKRITRYLCHSKTEGLFGYVVENIIITNDKESRPLGYSILDQTFDTNQKALKKKQLCYKAVPRNMATQMVSDIIILSKSKAAPDGFTLVGEMNGLTICVKIIQCTVNQNSVNKCESLPYNVAPSKSGESRSGMYPGVDNNWVIVPSRSAPAPPPVEPSKFVESNIYDCAQSALSGVPIIVNKKYVINETTDEKPKISIKSQQQIEDDYYYSFAIERDILNRPA